MQISIIGCGWLGLPLAESLLKKGYAVKGSTSTHEKLPKLARCGIDAYQILINEDQINGNTDAFLQNSEILVINIPPKLRGNSNENFVSKIKNLIPFIEKSSVKKLIFVSSTSVYEDQNITFTENCIVNPETQSGQQLLKIEKILLQNPSFKSTIIRFGGLIGDDRHPIRMLAGKTNISNPGAAINLIHLVDCIGIIQACIEANFHNGIYNGVAPLHQSREEYYTQKAHELGLDLPNFDHSKPSVGKIVSSEKIICDLDYVFIKPYL